jgi:hypothetical protein
MDDTSLVVMLTDALTYLPSLYSRINIFAIFSQVAGHVITATVDLNRK